MRYISDCHIGKINPQHFKFGLSVEAKKYDLPTFLRERAGQWPGCEDGTSADRAAVCRIQAQSGSIAALPAPGAGRRRREASGCEQIHRSLKSLRRIARLTRLLRLLGDMPVNTAAPQHSNLYQGALVDGVKRFQSRHGLKPDGRLDEQTLKHLNTPLSQRVDQLRLTLERWHWLPERFTEPPILVNIPEFRLRAFDSSGNPELTMKVIVGKAFRHKLIVSRQVDLPGRSHTLTGRPQ